MSLFRRSNKQAVSDERKLFTDRVVLSSDVSELEAVIRANRPYVHISSAEEGRVVSAIEAARRSLNDSPDSSKHYILLDWSPFLGLVNTDTGENITASSEGNADPELGDDSSGYTNNHPFNRAGSFSNFTNVVGYLLSDEYDYSEKNCVTLVMIHPPPALLKDAELTRFLVDFEKELGIRKVILIFISPSMPQAWENESESCGLRHNVLFHTIGYPSLDELNELIERKKQYVSRVNASLNEEKYKIPTEEEIKEIAVALQGLTLREAEDTLLLSLVRYKKMDPSFIFSAKADMVQKGGLLKYVLDRPTEHAIGGLQGLKDFAHMYDGCMSEEAKAFGVDPLRGIMLIGPPGSGKSLAAKALASIWDLPLIQWDIGRAMHGLVGASEARMRQAIQQLESSAPALVWIDEIEKVFSGTRSSATTDGGTLDRMFSTLLTAMQEGLKGIIFVVTANDVSKLPPELLRRFNEIFLVDLPTSKERRAIFNIHLSRRNRDSKAFDMRALVEATKGYSGAEIEKAIQEAIVTAFSRDEEDITTEGLLASVRNITPISRVMGSKINSLREWARSRARPASGQKPRRAAPAAKRGKVERTKIDTSALTDSGADL